MSACPICTTPTTQHLASSPYFLCPECYCGFQDPFPPKLYVADTDPAQMDDNEKAINRSLAGGLFANVMKCKPGDTLDVGGKLPILAQALGKLTRRYACALDPDIVPLDGVDCMRVDFEQDVDLIPKRKFALVTMIHVFEHMYDPLTALRRLRTLTADDGRLFIRLPQHDVTGYERDLTADHYRVHPVFHSMQSVLETLRRAGDLFVVESVNRMDGWGQADFTMRPL